MTTTIDDQQAPALDVRAFAQKAHADRVNREIEARRASKEYRQAQREAERVNGKHCSQCAELKPPNAFDVLPSGNLRFTCRDCRKAKKDEGRLKVQAQRRKEREAERSAKQAALRADAEARRVKRKEVKHRPLSPEGARIAAERIAYLASLLTNTNRSEWLTSERSVEAAERELKELWNRSGEKQCMCCKAHVSPSAMHPPGFPGHAISTCYRCVGIEREAEERRKAGVPIGPLPYGGPRIPMKDGTRITVAEFARRVRARETHRSIG